MRQFRRAMRWFFALFGFGMGIIVAIAAYFARTMIAPARQRLWATPADVGLDYEDVQFPAVDGVRLSGWFIPAADVSPTTSGVRKQHATIVLLHGWTWNRLGYAGDDLMANVVGGGSVDFLRLAHALHLDEYHVLTFDMRNHGQSAASHPVTFGQSEAKDLLGALAYLNGRSDVDPQRIGVIGFSMGGTTMLYTLPQTAAIKAAIAVQPVIPATFSKRLSRDLLGPFGPIVRTLAEMIYHIFGGPHLSGVLPAFVVAGAGDTPVLFVQGKGDPWGKSEDVSQLAEMMPQAQETILLPTENRHEGYDYLIDNPQVAINFFNQNL